MTLTRELLADGYQRGLMPTEIAAELGFTRSYIQRETDRYGLRPEYERVRAERDAARVAAQKARREAARVAQLRREHERWRKTCLGTRAKHARVVEVEGAAVKPVERAMRSAWLAANNDQRSDGTANTELAVWIREFLAETDKRHVFDRRAWTEWAHDKEHVRLRTGTQVGARIAFDDTLMALFEAP